MQYLKKSCFVFILFLSTCCCADEASNQLVTLLQNLHSLQAKFTQTIIDGRGNQMQQTTGDMAMQRPGKFRWETQQPSQQLLIADGKKIWFYDVALQQVTEQKQQSSNQSSPAMLLNGDPDKLAKNFIIHKDVSVNNSDIAFKLTSKTKDALFNNVSLQFKAQQLQSMKLTDNFGQITQINFSDVKTNPSLSSSLFQFTPPHGIDVIRQ